MHRAAPRRTAAQARDSFRFSPMTGPTHMARIRVEPTAEPTTRRPDASLSRNATELPPVGSLNKPPRQKRTPAPRRILNACSSTFWEPNVSPRNVVRPHVDGCQGTLPPGDDDTRNPPTPNVHSPASARAGLHTVGTERKLHHPSAKRPPLRRLTPSRSPAPAGRHDTDGRCAAEHLCHTLVPRS